MEVRGPSVLKFIPPCKGADWGVCLGLRSIVPVSLQLVGKSPFLTLFSSLMSRTLHFPICKISRSLLYLREVVRKNM